MSNNGYDTGNSSEFIDELEKLKRLLDLGAITKKEFEAKKKEILTPYMGQKNTRKPLNKKVLLWVVMIIACISVIGVLLSVPSLGVRCLIFGHQSESEYKIKKLPTCSEEGESVLDCKVCGKTIETKVISKTGSHNYVNGKCTVCGIEDPNWGVEFKVRTLVELHVRKGPGLSYDVIRNLPYYSTVTVTQQQNADGYTWNKIGPNEWIANDGTWLEYIN